MNTTTLDPSTMTWEDIKQMVAATTLHMAETDRRMAETDRQMKETDRKFRELANQFTSQSGHIIEGLMEPSAIRIFQERGYDINRCWKNFKRHTKSSGQKLEVDLLLLDDDIAIIVEVKIDCTHHHIDHFIEQMGHFKEVCPEYKDKRILLAVAAVTFERDADQYAHEKGLFVIRVTNDNIFSLDDNEGDRMLEL